MADALGTESHLLGSTASGYTYGGSRSAKKRRGLVIALIVITVLIAGIITIIYFANVQGTSSSSTPTPAPVESYVLHGSHMHVDLVQRISTFRSSIGGDFPGYNSQQNKNHTCGAFKHVFHPFDDLQPEQIGIYSPLTGMITGVSFTNASDASYGSTILITGNPSENPSEHYKVQIDYVNVTEAAIRNGNNIKLGDTIGHHIGHFVDSHVSVVNFTTNEYVSLFMCLDENALTTNFLRWNVSNRTQPIITYQQREAYPLNCSGDGKTEGHPITSQINNGHPFPNWIELNTTSPSKRKEKH